MDRPADLIRVGRARRELSMRLAAWAGASMLAAAGAWMCAPQLASISARRFVDAAGAQMLLWGLIDAGFALFGLRQVERLGRRASAHSSAGERADLVKYIRLLSFSKLLNFLWITLGAAVTIIGLSLGNAWVSGHGFGVIVQAGFLLLLERHYLPRLSEDLTPAPATF